MRYKFIMKFFDSHSHLNFKAFNDDYPKIIKKCLDENLWLINVGSRYDTSEKAVAIAGNYEKGVWAAIGLHPTHVGDENFDYQKYLALAKSSDKVVAVGETGLDYYRTTDPQLRIKQKELFLNHLKLAQELDKPLIIHCREAYDELIKELKNTEYQFKGVVHCFSGNSQQAKQYLDLGLYLGFTGIITYSSDYDDIIRDMPLEKILIETDCPYLAPVPYRGQRNEPLYVKYTAQKIAEICGLSLEKVAEQTYQNAIRLFGL
ncbi:MAG: TatD family hydrolase [bacterium]|nr:TatD family hydrolase [bacterium]